MGRSKCNVNKNNFSKINQNRKWNFSQERIESIKTKKWRQKSECIKNTKHNKFLNYKWENKISWQVQKEEMDPTFIWEVSNKWISVNKINLMVFTMKVNSALKIWKNKLKIKKDKTNKLKEAMIKSTNHFHRKYNKTES